MAGENSEESEPGLSTCEVDVSEEDIIPTRHSGCRPLVFTRISGFVKGNLHSPHSLFRRASLDSETFTSGIFESISASFPSPQVQQSLSSRLCLTAHRDLSSREEATLKASAAGSKLQLINPPFQDGLHRTSEQDGIAFSSVAARGLPSILRQKATHYRLLLSAMPRSFDPLTKTVSIPARRYGNAPIFSVDFGDQTPAQFETIMASIISKQADAVLEYLRDALLSALNDLPTHPELRSKTLNNLAIMYFKDTSQSLMQLRKQGLDLLRMSISIPSQSDRARANLALLSWNGGMLELRRKASRIEFVVACAVPEGTPIATSLISKIWEDGLSYFSDHLGIISTCRANAYDLRKWEMALYSDIFSTFILSPDCRIRKRQMRDMLVVLNRMRAEKDGEVVRVIPVFCQLSIGGRSNADLDHCTDHEIMRFLARKGFYSDERVSRAIADLFPIVMQKSMDSTLARVGNAEETSGNFTRLQLFMKIAVIGRLAITAKGKCHCHGQLRERSHQVSICTSHTMGNTLGIYSPVELLEQAISIHPLARYKVLLARILTSCEVRCHRDPIRAKELLEEAVRDAQFLPAMQSLRSLLANGDEGVPRDTVRAEKFRSIIEQRNGAGCSSDSISGVETLQIYEYHNSREYAEERLKEGKAKQSQVFLLVLGGGGRGKTSLVRSLKRLPFHSAYNPTELAAVSRLQVLLGAQRFSEEDVEDVAFLQDSLTAILSRQASKSPRDTPKLSDEKARLEWAYRLHSATMGKAPQDAAKLLEQGRRSESGIRSDQANRQRESTKPPAIVPSLNSSSGRKVSHRPNGFSHVFSRLEDAFMTSPLPTGHHGALVQFWDLAGQSQYIMAHSLFINNGNVFVFVVNLRRLWDIETRTDEIRELCRWMELVYASVEDVASIVSIIVGTHRDSCADLRGIEDILHQELLHEVGEAVYNSWLREGGEYENERGRCIPFIAVENSTAVENPKTSGIQELEEHIKRLSCDIIASRQEVPVRWIAFVEEIEKSKDVFLNIRDIAVWIDGFPAFSKNKKVREQEALQALRYFSKLGRIVLLEISEEEVYLFPRPTVLLDFVRQVTGPEYLARRRLSQQDGKMLARGLLTYEGLKSLWSDHSNATCRVMLDILCRFDILMRLQASTDSCVSQEELICIPALLPGTKNGLHCVCRPGESQLRMHTEFVDAFPPGLIGCLISYLHRSVGGSQTRIGLLGSDGAILTSRVELKKTGRVVVSLVGQRRRIEWKVFAPDPLRVARSCLRAIDDFSRSPLRGRQFRMRHILRTNCRSDLNGCGAAWAVEFELQLEWIRGTCDEALAELQGECVSPCKEIWQLGTLVPEMTSEKTGRISSDLCSIQEGSSKKCDVFISHAGFLDGMGSDKLHVAWPLCQKLRGRGMRCFLDIDSIRLVKVKGRAR